MLLPVALQPLLVVHVFAVECSHAANAFLTDHANARHVPYWACPTATDTMDMVACCYGGMVAEVRDYDVLLLRFKADATDVLNAFFAVFALVPALKI